MPLDEITLIEYSLGILDDRLRQDVERELATTQAALQAIEASLGCVAEAEGPLRSNERVRSGDIARVNRHHLLPSCGFCGPPGHIF